MALCRLFPAIATAASLLAAAPAFALSPSSESIDWANQVKTRLLEANHPYIKSVETGETYVFGPHAYVRIRVTSDFQGSSEKTAFCKQGVGLREQSRQALTGHPVLPILETLCR